MALIVLGAGGITGGAGRAEKAAGAGAAVGTCSTGAVAIAAL